MAGSKGTRVLVIVQNLPVPLDRRVWLECQALTRSGYSVSVICPKGPGDPAYEEIDGVAIHKYAPPREAEGLKGYLWEFVYCWIRTALLSLRAYRRRGFDVIQACNPPDTYWALAALWRLRGVRFVYDQHDLNPELFLSRFGTPRGAAQTVQYRGLVWLERMTYRLAHRVISTNESYRRVALQRGHLRPDHVSVVRSGPDTDRMRPVVAPQGIRRGGDHLLVYLGIMGPQDGVDNVLLVMDELVNKRGRTGLRAALMGFGDCLADLKRQCTALGLDPYVEFTGRVGPDRIADYFSSADIGLGPDAKTPLNDVSTMNKVMEYMSYALPCVSFDLTESRVSAGETGVFVPSGDIGAFADAIEALLDDPERRVRMSVAARRRVAEALDWRPQAEVYVRTYDGLTGRSSDLRFLEERSMDEALTPWGRPYVDISGDGLERFVRERAGAARVADPISGAIEDPVPDPAR